MAPIPGGRPNAPDKRRDYQVLDANNFCEFWSPPECGCEDKASTSEISAKIMDALARINSGGQYNVLSERYYPDNAWHPVALFALSAVYYFGARKGFYRRPAVIR